MAGFLKAEFLAKRLDWDEAKEIMIKVENSLTENMEDGKVLEVIRQLDDDDKRLTPLVFRLMGKV